MRVSVSQVLFCYYIVLLRVWALLQEREIPGSLFGV